MKTIKINFTDQQMEMIHLVSEESEFGAAVRSLCQKAVEDTGHEWQPITRRGQHKRYRFSIFGEHSQTNQHMTFYDTIDNGLRRVAKIKKAPVSELETFDNSEKAGCKETMITLGFSKIGTIEK
ncbi:hypothetical protein KAR91_26255 [Candidatus Pacearchaeota archaeon]|nr:hypothetical protein [Candidatus Pacearchaeota archaeon]